VHCSSQLPKLCDVVVCLPKNTVSHCSQKNPINENQRHKNCFTRSELNQFSESEEVSQISKFLKAPYLENSMIFKVHAPYQFAEIITFYFSPMKRHRLPRRFARKNIKVKVCLLSDDLLTSIFFFRLSSFAFSSQSAIIFCMLLNQKINSSLLSDRTRIWLPSSFEVIPKKLFGKTSLTKVTYR
jgi:hypothetical protein